MKLKFKLQEFQTKAVQAVTDCFIGQVKNNTTQYSIQDSYKNDKYIDDMFEVGFKNSDLTISKNKIFENITATQRRQNITISTELVTDKICDINLDVEMETGTGKTYCYINTIFELNKLYGWSKFIIVVPSIAIREGAFKSLQITADHFLERYGKKARFFIACPNCRSHCSRSKYMAIRSFVRKLDSFAFASKNYSMITNYITSS